MNTSLCLALGQRWFLCDWTKSWLSESNAEESVLVLIIYSCADVYTRGEKKTLQSVLVLLITALPVFFKMGGGDATLSNFNVSTW